MVAFDFSPSSKRALEFGLILGEKCGVPLEALIVIHPRLFRNQALPGHPKALKEAATTEIVRVQKGLFGSGPYRASVLCLKGWPSARIVEYGVECRALMILLGKTSHKRSGLRMGLIARQVLYQALTNVGVFP